MTRLSHTVVAVAVAVVAVAVAPFDRHGIFVEFQTEEEEDAFKKTYFPSKLYLRSPEKKQICSSVQCAVSVFAELAQEAGQNPPTRI